MTATWADRVQETFTTTGTGAVSLAGAITGYQAFSAVVADAGTCYYGMTDGTNWEVGLGTYATSGNTLTRTTVTASSNGGAAVNWSAGTKSVWLDLAAAAISLFTTPPAATSSSLGLTQPDGTIITVAAGLITVAKASAAAFGVAKVDGTTIAATAGVLSVISSSGAMKFLGSVTASSNATIDLTSLLSATYDDYLITLDNIFPSANGPQLLMRCSADDSTFDTGSNYTSLGSTIGVSGDTTASGTSLNLTVGAANGLSTGAGYGWSGNLWLYDVNNTAHTKKMTAIGQFLDGTTGGTSKGIALGLIWSNTTDALEAVRFLMSSGNIASGTFKVYGIAKS